jgi:DNA-binding transcriptional ArsR family regulator
LVPIPQFSALADPVRVRVLELLQDRPKAVHELAAAFDITRPAISRHLRVLKEAGLVREEKQGRENFYALESHELLTVNRWLTRFWSAHMTRLQRRRRARPAVGDLFALE